MQGAHPYYCGAMLDPNGHPSLKWMLIRTRWACRYIRRGTNLKNRCPRVRTRARKYTLRHPKPRRGPKRARGKRRIFRPGTQAMDGGRNVQTLSPPRPRMQSPPAPAPTPQQRHALSPCESATDGRCVALRCAKRNTIESHV